MMRARPVAVTALMSAASAVIVSASAAQTVTMPSTQRYGSGLLDIPVSSVLPHGNLITTFSGFWSSLDRRTRVDGTGQSSGFGPGRSEFFGDVSAAMGLFDRAEFGLTLQSLNDDEDGGDVWGLFGRVRLWEPVDQGVGFAVGGRYVTSPQFDGQGFPPGVTYAPGRLGFPDERLRARYTGGRQVDTNLSLYGVATAHLRGMEGGFIPTHDMTLTLGYGGGMFGSGGGLDFYAPTTNNGWFFGTALHIPAAREVQVTVMAEHNGLDINVGAQMDWRGVRVGLQALGLNHDEPVDGPNSEYQQGKLGFTLSAAICPWQSGFRCRPRPMTRSEPDTIYIPAPPPDTVLITDLDGTLPAFSGEPGSICLATGQNVPIEITTAGDTLVGSPPAPIRSLRPAMTFAGSYAAAAFWYLDGEVIEFEGADFEQSEDLFPIDCGQILRVGVHRGVSVFAVISARRPLDMIFIPVRPGLWHRYERRPGRRPEPS